MLPLTLRGAWIEDIYERDGEENIWISVGSDRRLEETS
jgi:hypothetical protein